jgi:hypothetical protein
MQNQGHQCIYCSRTYKRKDNYSKHVVSCAFFHNLHLQSRDDFNLSVEDVPNPREMYHLMKEMAHKCHELEKKVAHLEQTVNIRQKKQIITWLNTHRGAASLVPSLYEWTKSLHVTDETLNTVFKQDLTEGIKEVLSHAIAGEKPRRAGGTQIPLASFTQKANTLYVYMEHENGTTWAVASSDNIEKMIFTVAREIMRKFMEWRTEHEAAISESEDMKDKEILYMIKVNGSRVPEEKRTSDIKKWLTATLEEDLDMYEYV